MVTWHGLMVWTLYTLCWTAHTAVCTACNTTQLLSRKNVKGHKSSPQAALLGNQTGHCFPIMRDKRGVVAGAADKYHVAGKYKKYDFWVIYFYTWQMEEKKKKKINNTIILETNTITTWSTDSDINPSWSRQDSSHHWIHQLEGEP